MGNYMQRPAFFEGQILGADDLARLLEYAREQDSRHHRYLHTWGIAYGLEVEEQNDEFVLQQGVAIDSSGALLIVAKPIILSVEQLYDEALPGDQDGGKLFPLFVTRTQQQEASDAVPQTCGPSAGTRVSEGATVRYRPFATGWDEQAPLAVTAGPIDREESDRVVLVGFVEWREEGAPKGSIAAFHRRDESAGIGPRYAGVAADEVVARGGELVVRSRSSGHLDAAAVVVGDHDSGKDEKAFTIGLDDGSGGINALLTVDPKGNLHLKGNLQADGALKGQIRSGEVAIESGIAHDGLTLPLPTGIDASRVENGEVTVHTIVTPRVDAHADPRLDSGYLPAVTECDVDEDRVVRCTIRWFKPGEAVFAVAGAVNYTIMASVVAASGGGL